MDAVQIQRPVAQGDKAIPRQRQHRAGIPLSIYGMAQQGRSPVRSPHTKRVDVGRPSRARIYANVRGNVQSLYANDRTSISLASFTGRDLRDQFLSLAEQADRIAEGRGC